LAKNPGGRTVFRWKGGDAKNEDSDLHFGIFGASDGDPTFKKETNTGKMANRGVPVM